MKPDHWLLAAAAALGVAYCSIPDSADASSNYAEFSVGPNRVFPHESEGCCLGKIHQDNPNLSGALAFGRAFDNGLDVEIEIAAHRSRMAERDRQRRGL